VVVVVVEMVVEMVFKIFQVHFNMTNTESCDLEFEMTWNNFERRDASYLIDEIRYIPSLESPGLAAKWRPTRAHKQPAQANDIKGHRYGPRFLSLIYLLLI
jgi:hypothetical protein